MLLKETDRQIKEKVEEIEKLRSRIVWLERQQSELFQERIDRETLIKSPPAPSSSSIKESHSKPIIERTEFQPDTNAPDKLQYQQQQPLPVFETITDALPQQHYNIEIIDHQQPAVVKEDINNNTNFDLLSKLQDELAKKTTSTAEPCLGKLSH